MDLSIVIPVFRSEKILPELIRQIDSILKDDKDVRQYEVILVNDCSPDGSWQVIEQLCDQYPVVRGINLRKNTGQHNAIMAGLNHATGQVVVLMDDDMQHPPKSIKQLYDKIKEGYDVCYTRYLERKHSLWKKFCSSVNDKVADLIIGKPKDIYLSSFKAMSGAIKDEVIKYTGPFAYVDGSILMLTNRLTSIDVEHQDRYEGRGNYTFIRGFLLWMQMATNFSIIPLRIASFLGLLSSLAGFLFAICLIIETVTKGTPVQGWSSTIVTILIMGGIQLFALGMIGEYVGRVYVNLNKKPQFVIKAKRNLP